MSRITEWDTDSPKELKRQLKLQEQTIEKLKRELAEEKKRVATLWAAVFP